MKKLIELYRKYEEIIMYLIVGVCTTVVSLGFYYIFAEGVGMHYQAANILSWIAAVIFAYATNKRFVFRSPYNGAVQTIKEAAGFVSSRIVSLGAEVVCMFIGVQLLGIDDGIMKLADQVIVTVLNYVLSKFFVFRNN